MDADRFDTLTRRLIHGYSRRGATRLLGSLALGGLLALDAGDSLAGKGKSKKKKKRGRSGRLAAPGVICTPRCTGRRCGDDGCGGTCGACAECQTCEPALGRCPMTPGSDTAACGGGSCCGGACCPLPCQCGVSGISDALARQLAESQGLPYPACFATSTGQSCGALGGTCQTGTTCQPLGDLGIGVCVGL